MAQEESDASSDIDAETTVKKEERERQSLRNSWLKCTQLTCLKWRFVSKKIVLDHEQANKQFVCSNFRKYTCATACEGKCKNTGQCGCEQPPDNTDIREKRGGNQRGKDRNTGKEAKNATKDKQDKQDEQDNKDQSKERKDRKENRQENKDSKDCKNCEASEDGKDRNENHGQPHPKRRIAVLPATIAGEGVVCKWTTSQWSARSCVRHYCYLQANDVTVPLFAEFK